MKPIDIKGATIKMNAPPGAPDVITVSARAAERLGYPCLETAWLPDERERQLMEDGQPVILSCMGRGMPPVLITVEPHTCDVCMLEVEAGEETTIGGARHIACNAIAWDELTPAQQEASKQQLAEEIGETLGSNPQRWVELKDGKWMDREDVPGVIEKLNATILQMATVTNQQTAVCAAMIDDVTRLEGIVRVLAAQLTASGAHSDLTRRVAGDALARMRQPGEIRVIDVTPKLQPAVDALARIAYGLAADDSARNFDPDKAIEHGRARLENYRARLQRINALTKEIDAVAGDEALAEIAELSAPGAKAPKAPACSTCCGPVKRDCTREDPCPECGLTF